MYTVLDVTHVGRDNGRVKILEELEISRAIFEVSGWLAGVCWGIRADWALWDRFMRGVS